MRVHALRAPAVGLVVGMLAMGCAGAGPVGSPVPTGPVGSPVSTGPVGSGVTRECGEATALLHQATELEDGEVMVCEMTLPPWVPVFSVAGAIVADVGGILSHTAIVAREFGVPAVVGTEVGTTVVKTGQTITVDGTKGYVYLDGRTAADAATTSAAF